MTLFNRELERILRMSNSFFNMDDIFENFQVNSTAPIYYGYTVTVGPDGRAQVKEYGNTSRPTSDTREPIVDVIPDDKSVKLVAEMPGVEKSDVKITVQNRIVDISVENGDKKYHAKVPIQHKIDENSAQATYKNGILELTFKLIKDPNMQRKTVEVK